MSQASELAPTHRVEQKPNADRSQMLRMVDRNKSAMACKRGKTGSNSLAKSSTVGEDAIDRNEQSEFRKRKHPTHHELHQPHRPQSHHAS